MLGPLAAAAWLAWLAFFATKVSYAFLTEALPNIGFSVLRRRISPLLMRSLIVTAGVAVTRLAASECPDTVHVAAITLSGAGVIAIAADAALVVARSKGAAAAKGRQEIGSARAGNGIVLSVAVLFAAEALQRSPSECAAPATFGAGISAAAALGLASIF